MPQLRERFSQIDFKIVDPNEEWEVPENLIILDTAVGIDKVKIFDDLEKFAAVPRISVHDFDALTNLRLLKKLGKIKSVKIIAVPEFKNDATLPVVADKVMAAISRICE